MAYEELTELMKLLPQKTTKSTTSNSLPLEQIFAQQQQMGTQGGMQELLKAIFTEGAQQVPELTRAFANASGARSSNNSGLALALSDLNKSLAGEAAKQLSGNLQNASTTAGRIADSSRQETTTQKSQGADKALMAMTVLNQASKLMDGKGGGLKKLKDLFGFGDGAGDAGSVFGGAGDVSGYYNSLNDAYGAFDQGSAFSFDVPDYYSNLNDAYGAFDTASNFSDVGDYYDSLNTAYEAYDTAETAYDTYDYYDNLNSAYDAFSSYADGGLVQRNKPQMGAAPKKTGTPTEGLVREKLSLASDSMPGAPKRKRLSGEEVARKQSEGFEYARSEATRAMAGKIAGKIVGSIFFGKVGGQVGGMIGEKLAGPAVAAARDSIEQTAGAVLGEKGSDHVQAVLDPFGYDTEPGNNFGDSIEAGSSLGLDRALESKGIPGSLSLLKGGCFITTAITQAAGKPDDCEELQILRNFRDTVLLVTEEGKELVAEYYRIAPEIVTSIDLLPASGAIYTAFDEEYLQPCIEYIRQGNTAEAVNLYKQLVKCAKLTAGV